MSLLLDPNLLSLTWLDHGFGTAASDDWPPEAQRASVKQIHSAQIVRADHSGFLGEGDAVVTSQAGVYAAIRTADCVPILLADPMHLAVAAIHAGWRGSAANIAGETVRRMTAEFGTKPGDLLAAIGPCIQACCYEVSAGVAQQFGQWVPALGDAAGPIHLDLVDVNRTQLLRAGIAAERISSISECTKCDRRFHSFRRDQERSGRMVSAIGIRLGH